MLDSLLDEDATTMAALIRSGDVSAYELTGAALARMEQREPAIQAFCTPTPELALAPGQSRGCPTGARRNTGRAGGGYRWR